MIRKAQAQWLAAAAEYGPQHIVRGMGHIRWLWRRGLICHVGPYTMAITDFGRSKLRAHLAEMQRHQRKEA